MLFIYTTLTPPSRSPFCLPPDERDRPAPRQPIHACAGVGEGGAWADQHLLHLGPGPTHPPGHGAEPRPGGHHPLLLLFLQVLRQEAQTQVPRLQVQTMFTAFRKVYRVLEKKITKKIKKVKLLFLWSSSRSLQSVVGRAIRA